MRMTDIRLAIDRLRSARNRIVAVAADWQARGVETSALTPALVDIQEALAELEQPAGCHRAAQGAAANTGARDPDRMQRLMLNDPCGPV